MTSGGSRADRESARVDDLPSLSRPVRVCHVRAGVVSNANAKSTAQLKRNGNLKKKGKGTDDDGSESRATYTQYPLCAAFSITASRSSG